MDGPETGWRLQSMFTWQFCQCLINVYAAPINIYTAISVYTRQFYHWETNARI